MSVLALASVTILSDTDLTIPSIGMRSVPSRLSLRSASLSDAALPGLLRSIARSRIDARLVTSIDGMNSSSFQITCSISAPYFASRTRVTLAALPVHVESPGRIHSLSVTEGSGIHACILPSGLSISSLVARSIVRHAPGFGANTTSERAAPGKVAASERAAVPFRNSRRCMMLSFSVFGSLVMDCSEMSACRGIERFDRS